MPAPAAQATSKRRCSSDSENQSESWLARAPAVSFSAPSRPSETPMPTITMDSTACRTVASSGIRPERNQMAELSPTGLARSSLGSA